MRHKAIFDPRGGRANAITTLTYSYAQGHLVQNHFHEQDQLIFAVSGVMTVHVAEGIFVVPAARAVWVPARVVHSIRMSAAVQMRTIYLKPRLAKRLPRETRVVNVSPLLREIILHVCDLGGLNVRRKRDAQWLAVLLEQLTATASVPLQLTLPRDPRALRVANAVMQDPSDRRSLARLCKKSGASKRTIERSFRHETAMTFGRWRQQFALLHAVRRLASGESVTSVALDVGYATSSGFIAMFRRALGTTPSRYFGNDVATSSSRISR